MYVSSGKANVVEVSVRLDKDDKLHQECLWARTYLDIDNWTLSFVSDCGNFSYEWTKEKHYHFLDFVSSIPASYLIDKIATEDVFSEEKSKNYLLEFLRESGEDDDTIYASLRDASFKNEIELIDFIEDILELPDAEQYCCYDYPNKAKVFVKIFTTIVQPEIKKYIRNFGYPDCY